MPILLILCVREKKLLHHSVNLCSISFTIMYCVTQMGATYRNGANVLQLHICVVEYCGSENVTHYKIKRQNS